MENGNLTLYKAVVAYDGSKYNGWQKQVNGLGIQQIIEKALSKIEKKEVSITASGRTDKGVHALGQVFHFYGSPKIAPAKWVQAINALLPLDIRILKVETVSPNFHARFSVKEKVYEYIISWKENDPFSFKYKNMLSKKPNIEKMKEASQYLLGEHDFTSFSSSKIDPKKPRVKKIYSITVENSEEEAKFIFVGNGFLRYQIRMMMGALLAVGFDEIEPAQIEKILQAKNKEACRYNAKSCGLYLKEVRYV